jgi:hypothetical protein
MIFDLRGGARKSKPLATSRKKQDNTRRRRQQVQENRPLTDFPEIFVPRVLRASAVDYMVPAKGGE